MWVKLEMSRLANFEAAENELVFIGMCGGSPVDLSGGFADLVNRERFRLRGT